jgi:uncharacterized protein
VETSDERAPWIVLLAAGFAGGALSGLFGVGGGIVMVPLLVFLARLSQHRAHATSLVAIIPVAAVAAFRFGAAGEVDVAAAAALSAGAIAGAPLGARLMHRTKEASLRISFGILLVVTGLVLLWP